MTKKKLTLSCGCKLMCEQDKEGNIISVNFDPMEVPLDCKKTWDMISEGKTFGTFQLHTHAGRSAAKKVKPSNIYELSDLMSIIRPGANDAWMDGKTAKNRYIDRKHKKEECISIHPAIDHITEPTQHIICYQEQCIAIGVEIAGFSVEESDKYLRKSIGKKDANLMAECKDRFLRGCVGNGKVTEEKAREIFDLIEAFGRYGFNKCFCPSSLMELESGDLVDFDTLLVGDKILDHKGEYTRVINKFESGEKEVFEITLESGKNIICTMDHKFLCDDTQLHPLWEIISEDLKIVCEQAEKITQVKPLGSRRVVDIEVDNQDHIFIANGIAISNSHGIGYSLNSYRYSCYPKAHFPRAFFTSLFPFAKDVKEIGEIINDAIEFDVDVLRPDVLKGNKKFILRDKKIHYGLGVIKGVRENDIDYLNSVNNLASLDWLELLYHLDKINKKSAENLIMCGAVDFSGKHRIYMKYQLQCYRELTDRIKEYMVEKNLRGDLKKTLEEIIELPTGKGMPCHSKVSIRKLSSTIYSLENTPISLDDNIKMMYTNELDLLGHPFTTHAIDQFNITNANCTCHEFKNTPIREIIIGVTLDNVNIYQPEGSQEMAFIEASDSTGSINCIAFSQIYKRFKLSIYKNNNVILKGIRSSKDDQSFIVHEVIQL